jgi:5-methylcytosine-specific restriction enzyme B
LLIQELAYLPINHFTSTLNAIQGSVHRYWRIGTTAGTNGGSFWPMMLERSCIAIGGPEADELQLIAFRLVR